MATTKRIILLSPFVIPTGLFVDTCSEVHIAGPGSAEPHAHLASEAVEPRFFRRCIFQGGWVWFFFGSPKQKWLQLPGLGQEGSGVLQAQGKLVGTKRKKQNLPPNCWILSSIPLSPAKPKGVQHFLAQDLGLTVSSKLCKPSSLL